MVEDLSVFFDGDDFAVSVTRQRPLLADLIFNGIDGVADRETMQGHVMAWQVELHFPASHDVVEGDTLVIGAVSYRVLRVDRVNDGAEKLAYLAQV